MQYARSLEKLSSSQAPVQVGRSRKLEPGSWSIGIYAGRSPLQLAPLPKIINPVLTAWDVKDIPAQYVADPFMLQSGSSWYMFFQVMNAATRCGEIGLATSRNGLSWQYQQIVLHESFGMSFPCVFRWNDDFYMIPETAQAGAIRLYRAVAFRFKAVRTVIIIRVEMRISARNAMPAPVSPGTVAAPILTRFAEVSSYARGKRVRISTATETYVGTTAGLEPNGLLRVERDDGRIEVVTSGDVAEAS